jgi:hypothetical protein
LELVEPRRLVICNNEVGAAHRRFREGLLLSQDVKAVSALDDAGYFARPKNCQRIE